MPIKTTTDAFVCKAKQVHCLHGYEYAKVIYINSNIPVHIICPSHGSFYQRPDNHLSGARCPKCATINRLKFRRSNIDNFIGNSNKIHGSKYDYSKSIYGKNNTEKVVIICKKHGKFLQTPNDHLNGCGCPKCGCDKSIKARTKTPEEFVKNAKNLWGDLYDYSDTKYVGCEQKVTIICKKHGKFSQTPSNHVNCEQGCPRCNFSKGEAKILAYLEMNGVEYIHQHWFSDCRSEIGKQQVLKFDFYIPLKNLLIEYNGKQHYKRGSFVGGRHHVSNKEFVDIKRRDKIKRKYAMKNKINLLIIKYTKINQIEKILEEQLTIN